MAETPAGDGPRTDTAERLARLCTCAGRVPNEQHGPLCPVPVVASLAREQAAEELEAAARRITNTVDPAGDGFTVRAACVSLLRDIAALRSRR